MPAKSTESSRLERWRFRGGAKLAAAVLAVAIVGGSFGASRVAAQASTTAPVGGITVIGYGEASAPAETALLQLLVSREDYGPTRAVRPSATPGAEEREFVDPIVEALTGAGVAEDALRVVISPVVGQYQGPSGVGLARIDAELEQPTPEGITELINTAVLAAYEQGVIIGEVGVGYDVADCLALEREARESALAAARERAEIQAELMELELGGFLAASDVPPSESTALTFFGRLISGETGCAPPGPTITEGVGINLPTFDPAGEAEVELSVQVAVTFEIQGPAGA